MPIGAHVALDGPDGAVDVGDGLPLGDLTDEDLAGLGERDHGRSGPGAFCVGDDGGFATFEDGFRANRIVDAILSSAEDGGAWTRV